MIDKVARFIATHQLLHEGEAVAVALSGGADSVALLRLLHQLGYPLVALHCNFHLRGDESDRDEMFVTRLCKSHDIPLHIKHFDTTRYASTQHISIEMAARELRYAWFEEMRCELRIEAIAVAHHADDQAETLLLNLIRGTGLRGLCGMHPRQGHIIRPLLGVSRQDILTYLASLDQDYVTDSTNLEPDARRNRLRLDILPRLRAINPEVDKALNNLSQHVRESLPFYQQGIDATFRKHRVDSTFPIALLNDPSATTLLHEWLQGAGFNESQHAEMIRAKDRQPGHIWHSPTHRVLLDRSALIIEDLAAQVEEDKTKTLHICIEPVEQFGTFDPQHIYCDADRLTAPLTLRRVQQADRFVPFGMKGKKLVSDFLTNQKMNRFERERQLALCCGQDIVWLVNVRADDRFKVTPSTKHIVRISLKEEQPDNRKFSNRK